MKKNITKILLACSLVAGQFCTVHSMEEVDKVLDGLIQEISIDNQEQANEFSESTNNLMEKLRSSVINLPGETNKNNANDARASISILEELEKILKQRATTLSNHIDPKKKEKIVNEITKKTITDLVKVASSHFGIKVEIDYNEATVFSIFEMILNKLRENKDDEIDEIYNTMTEANAEKDLKIKRLKAMNEDSELKVKYLSEICEEAFSTISEICEEAFSENIKKDTEIEKLKAKIELMEKREQKVEQKMLEMKQTKQALREKMRKLDIWWSANKEKV